MRKNILVASVLGLMVIVPIISLKVTGSESVKDTNQDVVVAKSLSDLPAGEVKEYQVQKGDTFAGVMTNMGIQYDDALAIMNSSKDTFDFTKINAGKFLKFVFVNEAFAAMEYPLNSDTVIHVKREDDSFKITEEDIPYNIEMTTAKGTITDSLFVAAQDVGVEDKVTLKLADIFSSDIDFATDIQDGDSFSVVYEKRTLDGKPASAGKVLGAKFTNDGTTYTAFRYNDKFYNEDGES
ncbi:MAG: hypothetical protein QG563_64, partial [Patescibacteria group bacterium]|nr:hypothetical protein [Patescibacteria group bacterium]